MEHSGTSAACHPVTDAQVEHYVAKLKRLFLQDNTGSIRCEFSTLPFFSATHNSGTITPAKALFSREIFHSNDPLKTPPQREVQ